ncbi:hypothetical protein H0H87_003474 [Tephrocybe sp. NHM501043]|nr:hypothetical protein H0H87_003474 [Tephrocybe sp. NHM501043]
MDHSVIDAALPFPSQTQTDYGDNITSLIIQHTAEADPVDFDVSTQSVSEPPTSTTPSLEDIKKRRLADSFNSSIYVAPSKKRKVDSISRELPYIIADSPIVQNYVGTVRSGVLFELARLVTIGAVSSEAITTRELNLLQGKNTDVALKIACVFSPDSASDSTRNPAFSQEIAATSPWEELDQEEENLARYPYAGLGHSDVAPGWYGGKVGFRGKLVKDDYGAYKVKLERCTLSPSCRFYRRFGSMNFLRIKIDKDILWSRDNSLDNFFCKAFILWGDVFRTFYAKEGNVFLYRTNERVVGNNGMTKWSARMALGLSNSVPGPFLEKRDIVEGEDIVSCSPGKSDMTDGCGTASLSVMLAVSQIIDHERYFVASQVRVGGGKGMLLENNETGSRGPLQVMLRPSQIKIRYPPSHHDPLDPTLRIIEILRPSLMRSPAGISAETIINLAENGVPPWVFVELMKANLREVVAGFTTWDGPDAMFNLWSQVERAGAVLHSRRAREAVGEARFRGLGVHYENDGDEADEDGMKFDICPERSTAWWADQTSGCPSSLEETVLVLLDAGFRPQNSPILRDKLKQVARTAVIHRTQKFRYELPQSTTAFVVPDHLNVLRSDEIHVKSSTRNFQTPDGTPTDIILGEVVITRNPCKLPTDVRKVTAVEHPLLRNYTDVIVCSIKGYRRLLDFLAGGDYDGDTAVVIWTPEIVRQFKNADEKYSNEPDGLGVCFTSVENESVSEFLARTSELCDVEKVYAMQTYLLGALRDPSIVGNYSAMYDNAVYEYGYSHPRTIKLAYKFCKVLDGAKTGLRIKPETYKSDKENYNSTRLRWKEPPVDTSKTPKYKDQKPYTKRGKLSSHIKGLFIMDVLHDESKKERDRILASFNASELFGPLTVVTDGDLSKPWNDACMASQKGNPHVIQSMRNDLDKIMRHVKAVHEKYKIGRTIKNGDNTFTDVAIETRQDILRKISKLFISYPTPDDMEVHTDTALIARLRASYAFVYDLTKTGSGCYTWSRFPWDVAMRELCLIKANALGPSKTVTNSFYERFKLARRC